MHKGCLPLAYYCLAFSFLLILLVHAPYDFWLWLCDIWLLFLQVTKIMDFHPHFQQPFAYFFRFILSLSLPLLTTYLTIPPPNPYYHLFFHSFISFLCLYTLLCISQLFRMTFFLLEQYARELFFFLPLSSPSPSLLLVNTFIYSQLVDFLFFSFFYNFLTFIFFVFLFFVHSSLTYIYLFVLFFLSFFYWNKIHSFFFVSLQKEWFYIVRLLSMSNKRCISKVTTNL